MRKKIKHTKFDSTGYFDNTPDVHINFTAIFMIRDVKFFLSIQRQSTNLLMQIVAIK